MRSYLRYLLTASALLVVLITGFLVRYSAGAQATAAAPAPAPRLTTPSPTPTCPPQWSIFPNPAPADQSILNGTIAIGQTDRWAEAASARPICSRRWPARCPPICSWQGPSWTAGCGPRQPR